MKDLIAGIVKKIVIILIWILIWQGVALLINNDIYFAGPIDTIKELFSLFGSSEYWLTIANSLGRILAGFFIAFAVGYGLSFVSYGLPIIKDFMGPFVSLIKSVPVASVVVMLLIWFGSENITYVIAFMVVFPAIYISMLEGLESTDPDMIEMARSFRMSKLKTYRYIYRAAYMSSLNAAIKVSIGMCFKACVAAEIIGLPSLSIGEHIYMGKIYFETKSVFAWTASLIVLSIIVEKILLAIVNWWQIRGLGVGVRPALKLERYLKDNPPLKPVDIVLNDITCSYGEDEVIKDFSYKFEKGNIYFLIGESGEGKTTLLNVIGQAFPESSRLFQEDRLCPLLTGLGNVCIVNPIYTYNEIGWYFEKVGLDVTSNLPILALSGGMKRRVALLRALLADGEVVLLDEPFAGLDYENKEKVAYLIKELQRDRCVIVTGHSREDADLLGAVTVELTN